MKKFFFQKTVLWLISLTSFMLSSCSPGSFSGGSSNEVELPTVENIVVTSKNLNSGEAVVAFDFIAPVEAEAVKIIATPSDDGITGGQVSKIISAKKIEVLIPREKYGENASAGFNGKVILKGLKPFVSYSFEVIAVSKKGKSESVQELSKVVIQSDNTIPKNVITKDGITLEKKSPIVLKWKPEEAAPGLVDFVAIKFIVEDERDKEIGEYSVEDISDSKVTLSVLTNLDDAVIYTIKTVYIGANGKESSPVELIQFSPSNLKTDLKNVVNPSVEAKDKNGDSVDSKADASLYVRWEPYDFSINPKHVIHVYLKIGERVVAQGKVTASALAGMSTERNVGNVMTANKKGAIWFGNLFGIRTYDVIIEVQDEHGNRSEQKTLEGTTTDETMAPVQNADIVAKGNSIIVAWGPPAGVLDYAGANIHLMIDKAAKKQIVKKLQVRSLSKNSVVFKGLVPGIYSAEIFAVDLHENESTKIAVPTDSSISITVAEGTEEDKTAPGTPISGKSKVSYIDSTTANLVVSWQPVASDKDIEKYVATLEKKEDDGAFVKEKEITTKYKRASFNNLERGTTADPLKYQVKVYAIDYFDNSDESNTLTISRIDISNVDVAPTGEVVFENFNASEDNLELFNNLLGATADTSSGKVAIIATLPVVGSGSTKTYLLRLYDSSGVNLIAEKIGASGKKVTFTEADDIVVPKGTEEGNKITDVKEEGKYVPRLYEIYSDGRRSPPVLALGEEVNHLQVADAQSTAPPKVAIAEIVDTGVSSLVYKELERKLEITFTEGDYSSTPVQGPGAGKQLDSADITYKIYLSAEEVDTANTDDIKEKDDVRVLQLVGKASKGKRTASFSGFKEEDVEEKTFTVVIESINSLNTSLRNFAFRKGEPHIKETEKFAEGAKIAYLENESSKVAVNTYTYNISASSPNVKSIALDTTNTVIKQASGSSVAGFAFTAFEIKHESGIKFKKNDSGDDAVTIDGKISETTTDANGKKALDVSTGTAGQITVDTNVEEGGKGTYIVSISATDDDGSYETIEQEVIIIIEKASLENVTTSFSPQKRDGTGFKTDPTPTISGSTVVISPTGGETGEIKIKGLPLGLNVKDHFTIKKKLKDVELENESKIVVVAKNGVGNEKNILQIIAKSGSGTNADTGAYSIELTPNAQASKKIIGRIIIRSINVQQKVAVKYNSDDDKNTLTFFANESILSFIPTTQPQVNSSNIPGIYTIKINTTHLPTGLSISQSTGEIYGTPTTPQSSTSYTVVFTPTDTALYIAPDETTVNIEIVLPLPVAYDLGFVMKYQGNGDVPVDNKVAYSYDSSEQTIEFHRDTKIELPVADNARRFKFSIAHKSGTKFQKKDESGDAVTIVSSETGSTDSGKFKIDVSSYSSYSGGKIKVDTGAEAGKGVYTVTLAAIGDKTYETKGVDVTISINHAPFLFANDGSVKINQSTLDGKLKASPLPPGKVSVFPLQRTDNKTNPFFVVNANAVFTKVLQIGTEADAKASSGDNDGARLSVAMNTFSNPYKEDYIVDFWAKVVTLPSTGSYGLLAGTSGKTTDLHFANGLAYDANGVLKVRRMISINNNIAKREIEKVTNSTDLKANGDTDSFSVREWNRYRIVYGDFNDYSIRRKHKMKIYVNGTLLVTSLSTYVDSTATDTVKDAFEGMTNPESEKDLIFETFEFGGASSEVSAFSKKVRQHIYFDDMLLYKPKSADAFADIDGDSYLVANGVYYTAPKKAYDESVHGWYDFTTSVDISQNP